jgi:hypothetical protein
LDGGDIYGQANRKNDMAVGSNESQNQESCEPSDASAQGEDKDKKAGKSRQANKKEA